VINEADDQSTRLADDVIIIPDADELVAPMLSVIPMQLLAYYIGIAKKLDVDKPRNLAKSVTVE
jgi:glucosamine--fructose-6-phosphate aminotransferase (isomerizing)